MMTESVKFKVASLPNVILDKLAPNWFNVLTDKVPFSKAIPPAKLFLPVIPVKSTFASP